MNRIILFMKNLLLLCLMIILSGCCCFEECECLSENKPCPAEKINSQEFSWIVQKLAVKWRKEFFLDLEDASIYYGNSVHTLRFEFTTMAVMDVRKARELLVDVVEGILDQVNRDPIASSELFSYPFGSENLELYIDFKSFYSIYADPLKVGFITLEEGTAKFWASDVKDNRIYSWHSRIEPYSRSREIVQLGRAAKELYKEENAKVIKPIRELYTP